MKVGIMQKLAMICIAVTLGLVVRTADGSSLRVGSYNITVSFDSSETWQNRKGDLVALIKSLNLDVFGLQEATPDQMRYFVESFPEFAFVGEHRESDRTSGEASPVCYRKSRFDVLKSGTFWLSETPDKPGSKSWRTACPRVCSWLVLKDKKTGEQFCFANVHMDHVSGEAREKGALLVVERMKEFGAGLPIVFTGDHNCLENEKPELTVSKLLKDALYATKTPPKGPWRTYNAWRWKETETTVAEALKHPIEVRNAPVKQAPPGTPDFGLRIDYIYVSPGVKVLDYEVHGASRPGRASYASDHFPVTVAIEL